MSATIHRIQNGGLARIVERQMRNWEIARTQRPTQPDVRPAVQDFIAISRLVGARGSEVAARVAEQLGWPFFDREILQLMAGDDHVRRQIYDSMDERDMGWLEEALRSITQMEFVRNDYFHQLCRTVLALSRQGNAVFLGRAADLILPRDRGLRIRIIASRDHRAATYAQRHGLGMAEAEKEIDRIEADRTDFIRKHFYIDANEQTRHDLIINLDRMSPDHAARLVLAALAVRDIRPPA